jgi:hypothetical protein
MRVHLRVYLAMGVALAVVARAHAAELTAEETL